MKSGKELLFERMHSVGGMPLKEDIASFIKNKSFQNPKTKQFLFQKYEDSDSEPIQKQIKNKYLF